MNDAAYTADDLLSLAYLAAAQRTARGTNQHGDEWRAIMVGFYAHHIPALRSHQGLDPGHLNAILGIGIPQREVAPLRDALAHAAFTSPGYSSPALIGVIPFASNPCAHFSR